MNPCETPAGCSNLNTLVVLNPTFRVAGAARLVMAHCTEPGSCQAVSMLSETALVAPTKIEENNNAT